MKTLSIILLLGILVSLNAQSQNELYRLEYTLLPSSSIGFDGSSNVNTFSYKSNSIHGSGFGIITPNKKSVIEEQKVKIILPVRTLNSGSDAMNEDMYKALKSDEYPYIEFDLLSAALSDSATKDNTYYLNTTGSLTVAGCTKKINMKFKVEKNSDNTYRMVGNKKLSMKEFGITPPTAFFGLIKADDVLEAKFNLVAEVQLDNIMLSKNYGENGKISGEVGK